MGVLCSLWPWRPSWRFGASAFLTPIQGPRKLAAVSWPDGPGRPAAWPPECARVPQWRLRVCQPFLTLDYRTGFTLTLPWRPWGAVGGGVWGEALFIEQHCWATHQPPAHQHAPSTTAKVSSTVVLCPRGARASVWGRGLGTSSGLYRWRRGWHILWSVAVATRA